MPRKVTLTAKPAKAKAALHIPDISVVKETVRRQYPKAKLPLLTGLKLRFGTAEEEGYTKMIGTWADQVVVSPPWHLPGEAKMIGKESVEAIFFAWYFHRLTLSQRFAALNEAYRVLVPGGQIMIVSPYWSSRRTLSDPLCQWPPVCEESFYVFSRAWREQEGMVPFIPLTCDFASVTPQGQLIVPAGHIPDPEVSQRNEEYRTHASRHFINSVWELHVTLTKVGEVK